jgi:hypothetical protein
LAPQLADKHPEHLVHSGGATGSATISRPISASTDSTPRSGAVAMVEAYA